MQKLLLFFVILATAGNTMAQSNNTTYTESPIVLQTTTGDIYGTLTLPPVTSKMPVALIIAGSGPTDRNGNSPLINTDSYKLLAYALASKNIASVRYDKRAIGESKAAAKAESDLRFDDYVKDATGWIELLKQDKRFSSVIVIGHSEGSLIGMVAKGADKFISMAGAGRPADQVLKEQLAQQPEEVKNVAFPILDSLKKGVQVTNVLQMYYSLFRPSVQPYMISWFKYDPAEAIKQLSIPVLVVQGNNDLQVSMTDASLLHAANAKSEMLVVDGMNHILRKVGDEKSENMKSYNEPGRPLDETFITGVTGFINK